MADNIRRKLEDMTGERIQTLNKTDDPSWTHNRVPNKTQIIFAGDQSGDPSAVGGLWVDLSYELI